MRGKYNNNSTDGGFIMKYCVVIVRTGCVFIEAENEAEAMDIANHYPTDEINWSDDWEATDCEVFYE